MVVRPEKKLLPSKLARQCVNKFEYGPIDELNTHSVWAANKECPRCFIFESAQLGNGFTGGDPCVRTESAEEKCRVEEQFLHRDLHWSGLISD